MTEHVRQHVAEERSPEPVAAQSVSEPVWSEPAPAPVETVSRPRERVAQHDTHRHEPVPTSYQAPPQTFALPPDLVQIETSPDKAQQVQANAVPATEAAAPRPRRPRPSDEPLPSEPLVQVETRH